MVRSTIISEYLKEGILGECWMCWTQRCEWNDQDAVSTSKHRRGQKKTWTKEQKDRRHIEE